MLVGRSCPAGLRGAPWGRWAGRERGSAATTEGEDTVRMRWAAVLGAVAVLGGVCIAVVPAIVASANPPVPPPTGAIVAGTAGPTCPSPSYSTIQSAIDAAPAGATIYVCAGTYDESPTIDKPLTLDGAQYDVDATDRGGSTETVIDGSGGITYTTGSINGTINGFTLQGYTGTAGEIDAVGVGANWRWVDDVVDVSNGGIYFNTDGITDPAGSVINRDLFVQASSSAAPTGDAGQAVIVAGGTANNVNIAYDAFTELSGPGAAVSTTQAGTCGSTLNLAQLSSGVAVIGDTFTEDGGSFTDPVNGPGFDDEPFVDLACTDSATVESDTVTITDAGDVHAAGPVDLSGGDWSTTVQHDTLTGGGASSAVGIDLNSTADPAVNGMDVADNVVAGFEDGVAVSGGAFAAPSGFTISHNLVSSSTADGIAVQAGGNGTVSQNDVSGSATDDCLDATTGSLSFATDDLWSENGGATSSPTGLCSGFVAPTLNLPATATATVGNSFLYTVVASGYPVPTFHSVRGLPPGLTAVANGNGTETISGTPTVRAAGIHRVTVRAANSARAESDQVGGSLTIQVVEAPTISSQPSTRAEPGHSFSFTVKAKGFPPPSLSESGPLPAGVTFTDHGNGRATLGGTPSDLLASASWPITITATDTAGSTNQAFVLTTAQEPRYTTASDATATAGVPFNFIITATGSPAPTMSETGRLPAGITFTDMGGGTGRISGTAAQGSAPVYRVTLTSTTGSVIRTRTFTLHVLTLPTFTTAATVSVKAGTAFEFTVRATGNPRPVVSETTPLPAGVVFVANAHAKAELGGAAAVGNWPITMSATNANGTVTQSFVLVVTSAGP